MNLVTLTGRLTANPEKVGSEGCKFSLAVQDGFGDKAYTSFFDCVAWKKPAESIMKYIIKGDGIIIQGKIKQYRYEKDGKKNQKVGVIVDRFEFPMAKKNDKKEEVKPFNDEEIPF
jgi:single-strand DNA-binding protein